MIESAEVSQTSLLAGLEWLQMHEQELCEQLTLNLLVVGSNPTGGTKFLKSFRLIVFKAIFFKSGENL